MKLKLMARRAVIPTLVAPSSQVDGGLRSDGAAADWKRTLPTLTGRRVVLRQLRDSDAASLTSLLGTDEVSRFVSPPPPCVEAFAQFVAWTDRQRAEGACLCFAVTLKDCDRAIGIFQMHALGIGFETAEWGFAIGSAFWGTGIFLEGAELVLEFAFTTLGVQRLEARAAARNGRGNRALIKVGAVQEAVLRKSFSRNGERLDQLLYSILADEWRGARPSARRRLGRLVQVH
jgi:RimJ/RimL family protein N-acetyltransferase